MVCDKLCSLSFWFKRLLQILEEEERRLEQEWERQRVAEARAGLILENHLKRKKKELEDKLREENQLLAKEQNAE